MSSFDDGGSNLGRPANEALLEEIKNYDANRVFLLASGTLNRNTDEIDKIREALEINAL